MTKTNKRRSGKVPDKKSDTSLCAFHSADTGNQHEDCDWVIVKKQRVTILVSAAPLSERSLTENQQPSHMPPVMSSNHDELAVETSNEIPSGNEQRQTISSSCAVQKENHPVRKAPPPLLKSPLANPRPVDPIIESEDPHEVSTFKSHKLLGVSNKDIKQHRALLAPRRYSNLAILNQGLRASNLERKLERAGGLSKWLTSLGLEQFVRIFQGRCVSKFQLVNLTMRKLKDMGASAVGPRRKLIHAIDCVCQPYCFEAL